MGASERRCAIMRLLCRRKSETVENIAAEFGVSERTVRRDIEALSLTEPIFTKSGRYGGGVYIMDGYDVNKIHFDIAQASVLQKVLHCAESSQKCDLSYDEIALLKIMVSEYTLKDA